MKAAAALVVAGLLAFSRRAAASSGRVQHRERAEGCRAPLLGLLEDWEVEGTHNVLVAPDGGLRTDAAKQAGYAAGGTSNAATLEATPHGRGAGLDVYPVSFLPFISGTWADVPPAVQLEFAEFGRFAEARGLVWGGRWRGSKFPNGDQPHVEIANWRSLPFPPVSA